MKPKLAVIALLLCVFSVDPWEGAASAKVPLKTEEVSAVSVFLPFVLLQSEDLDVRDLHNNPVKDAAAKAELASLFIETLFLAVLNPSLEMRAATAILESLSNLFNSLFFAKMKWALLTVATWVQSVERRLVHNVDKLWITPPGLTEWAPDRPTWFFAVHTIQHFNLRC